MAPISLNALTPSLPHLDHGVQVILAIIIGILLIIIALISSGLG
jgi:hypothetical protein